MLGLSLLSTKAVDKSVGKGFMKVAKAYEERFSVKLVIF